MSIELMQGDGTMLAWPEFRGDPPPLRNGPGQSELKYRIGTYDSWVELMVHALMDSEYAPLTSSPTVVSPQSTFMTRTVLPTSQKRRIRLNLSEEGNWILGLVKAWATVGHVLTFYQERLLNEGYLRTAVQPLSVHELVRLLDYRPGPAVGGSADLAFETNDVEGLPRTVLVAPGTPVTSVPPPGAGPQDFESGRQLEARAEWNLLRPPRLGESTRPVLKAGSTAIELSGVNLNLNAGSGLLLHAPSAAGDDAAGSREVNFFRLLSAVEPQVGEPSRTTARWMEPIALPSAELRELEAFVMRQAARPFGHNAPRWPDQSVALRRQYRPIEGGVQAFREGEGWRSLNTGLPEAAIQCLAADREGNVFAGTDSGVLCRRVGSETWRPGESGAAQLDVRALTPDPTGGMLAGTATGGVYRSSDRGAIWTELTGRTLGRARWTLVRRAQRLDRLSETPVRALLAVGEGEGWALVVGTDSGVYLSRDLANSWQPRNGGLPGVDSKTGETSLVIAALATGAKPRELWAGTAAGVFKSSNLGRSWQAHSRGLPTYDATTGLTGELIRCLAFYRDRRRRADHLFAGTSQGVFRSSDGGATWQSTRQGMRVSGGKDFPDVTSLLAVEDPITVTTTLLAGGEAGLWRSVDLGDNWNKVELGVPGIVALASGPRDELLVASPLGGFAKDEWPGFYMSRGHIDLDRLAPGVAANSWVVLSSDPDVTNPPPPAIYRVRRAEVVNRRDFTLEATVTRLEVERDPALHDFDLRKTRIDFMSDRLKLLPRRQPADLATAVAALRQSLAAMEPHRRVLVAAEAQEEWPTRAAAGLESDGASAAHEAPSDEGLGEDQADGATPRPMEPRALPYEASMSSSELDASLAEALRTGDLRLTSSRPGAVADPWVESRKVAIDALSLAVHGNVVEATEGRTVREEILGSGNGAEILQRFALGEPPTYLRGGRTGTRSTIEVRVQGQVWDEVSRLYGEEGDQRVYEVQRDHSGLATVIFGDGVYGARLPTGHGNVVATYRTGTSDREILPDSVRLMSSRPLGLSGVTNPFAGTPGSPAEPLDPIRWRAPRSILTFDRIVSLRDYEDFAWSFPGISKVTASSLPLAGRKIVQLTVATDGESKRPAPGSRLLSELLAAIEEIRCEATPIHILPFRRVRLEISARIRVAPGYFWEEIEPRLRAAALDRFSFEASRFGESLHASEAIRVLQSVSGVLAVDLDIFRRVDAKQSLSPRVVAELATWNAKEEQMRAAELIWLNAGHLGLRPTAAT